jgi:putative transposase
MARLSVPVKLPATDASALRAIVQKGTHKSRKITRARALLLIGAGKDRLAVQAAVGVSANQYYTLKRRYLAQGLDGALEERPRSGQPRKVTAALEARITSLACSELPDGAARWTLSLLNEKLVSLDYIEKISDESIRQVLKKAKSSPGRNRCGALAR